MKPHHVKLVLVAVLLFITAACKDEQVITPPESNTIQGQFVASDGSPLANILVEATDATGKMFSTFTTDAEGNFEIHNLPESNDNAIVSFINDNEVMQQLKLSTVVRLASEGNSTGKSKKVTVFLGEDYDYDASFAVIVVDKTTQERVPGAVVTMATSENAELSATSDADGVALFEKIVPGRYTVRIFKDCYNFYEESMLLVFPEGIDKFEFEFEITPTDGTDSEECCNNSVTISVLYANGSPVKKQEVSLHIEGKDNRIAYTNAHGIATFTEICTGVYEACTEYATANNTKEKYCVSVRVGCRDSATAIIRLQQEANPDPEECCNNTIVVEAYYSAGGPAKNQPVYLHNIHTGAVVTRNTDERGRVEFFELCSGSYVASGSKELINKDRQIVVTCNDRKATELELKKEETGDDDCCNNTLIIHLADKTGLTYNTGNPLGRVDAITVIDRNTGKELAVTKTDTMGTIAIHNLCKGVTMFMVQIQVGNAVFHM